MTRPGRLVPTLAAAAFAATLAACGDKPPPPVDKPAAIAPAAAIASSAPPKPAVAPESPDAALARRVTQALQADRELSHLAIDAKSAGGTVTLFGTADTPAHRSRAQEVARSVDGVRSVRNKMVIVSGS